MPPPRPILLSLGLAASACLFDGKETEGLRCTSDDHCGIGIDCVNGICGGTDACKTGQPVCVGPIDLQTCVNGLPLVTSCDEICQGNGLARAVACDYSPISGLDGCFCDEASSFCDADGVYECWDGDDARYCDGLGWQNLDCDGVCANDANGSGTGCGTDDQGNLVCWCTGGVCDEGEQYCVDSDTQAWCTAGAWTTYECADSNCESGISLGCGFLAAIGDETCLCAAS